MVVQQSALLTRRQAFLKATLILVASTRVACISVTWRKSDNDKAYAAGVQLAAFAKALRKYYEDTGSFPSSSVGFAALRVNRMANPNWHGPYLRKDPPSDPWGAPYVYELAGEGGDGVLVMSYGADKRQGGVGAGTDVVRRVYKGPRPMLP